MSMRMFIIGFFLTSLSCNAQEKLLNDMESAETIASERASEELVAYMSLENMFPERQVRAFAEAAGRGKIKEVEAFVEQGVDVNVRGTRNATPLFWAMRNNSIKGFNKLLELGADPNVVFDDGGTVMHWAVRHKDATFLNRALVHGGDPNLKAGQFMKTPLFEALGVQSSKLDILLDAGANINAQSSFGTTPSMVAAGRGRFDIVLKLLDRGADYKLINNSGHSLATRVADKRDLMDPNHELYARMQKVIEWLEERGVYVPE